MTFLAMQASIANITASTAAVALSGEVPRGPLGYLGKDVGEEYIVTITDNRPELYTPTGVSRRKTMAQPVVIKALLQEKISLTTEAEWSPLTAASIVRDVGREVGGWLGRSLVSKFLTRRIWRGTSPLDFTLNLRFEAETDAQREVLSPCKELHRMVLPYRGSKALGAQFLSPPGPYIGDYAKGGESFWNNPSSTFGRGEIIDIQIGGLMLIKRVIVKKVTVEYHPRFAKGGAPMGANVSINFQTFEILTKESLDSEVYEPLKTQVASPYDHPAAGKNEKSLNTNLAEFATGPHVP